MDYDDIIYDDDMFDIENSDIIKEIKDAYIRMTVNNAISMSNAKAKGYNPVVMSEVVRLKKWFEVNYKDETKFEIDFDFICNNINVNISFFEVWETDGLKSKNEFVSLFDGVQNFSILTQTDGVTVMTFQFPNAFLYFN